MSRKYYDYVTRVVGGHGDVLPKHSWWPRHGASMTRYLLEAAKHGDGRKARGARDLLVATAAEWENYVPPAARKLQKANPRMCGHARIEREMVDAALVHDRVALERLFRQAEKNVTEQSLMYGKAIPGFPEFRFSSLMNEHLRLFLESARAHLLGELGRYEESERRRGENTVALFVLTANWF